ncbi:hypothetical protein LAZ67_1007348 [Cordylochernes scorpioides]|uniref:Uncharacterized protein n=1 Tax=Cordylochernes scorpioides TaxID=51811 RepID=A0ABY6K0D7_9ARAC|nr:hypothetical protein LAZ67_1007348 [Cordylochernes scorpioides]
MKSLRCLHASLSQQSPCPLSWVCKAAALGPCQFSARLRPLLGMRILVRLRLHFIIIRKVLASKVQLEFWKKMEVAWGKFRRIRWMCENFLFEVFQQRLGRSSCVRASIVMDE